MPEVVSLASLFVRSEKVAARKIADELILVPIRTDPNETLGVYTLNPTALVLWEMLDGKKSVSDLISAVVDRFEIDYDAACKDCETFCQDMLSAGLIEANNPWK